MPPLVGLDVENERQFRGNHRDACLLLEQSGNRPHLIAQPSECGLDTQNGELEVQEEEVKTLRLLVFRFLF